MKKIHKVYSKRFFFKPRVKGCYILIPTLRPWPQGHDDPIAWYIFIYLPYRFPNLLSLHINQRATTFFELAEQFNSPLKVWKSFCCFICQCLTFFVQKVEFQHLLSARFCNSSEKNIFICIPNRIFEWNKNVCV